MATDLTSTSSTTMDDLPEGILLRILSFLPAIDAISTTSVSSKWRYLWLSSPTLDFCIASFASRFNLSHLSSEIRQLFAEFITRILFLRIHNSSPLNKFQLSFDYQDYDCHKDYVDNWILFAVSWKCKVLILYLQNDEYSDRRPDDDDDEDDDFDKFCIYRFDFSSLLHSSVEVVKLQGCNFCIPSTSITSLKSLYLKNIDFIMDDSNFAELIPLCVNLEFLSITGTGRWHCFKIASLSLKELILSIHTGSSNDQSYLEICAPNLRIVSFYSFCVGKCILQGVTSLVEAHILFHIMNYGVFTCWSNLITPLSNVERLTVENMWIWYKLEETDDQTTSDDEHDNNSDHESDEESNYALCGKKVPISKEIFSENFAFNNLNYLKLLTGFQKREVLGLELCLEMCPKLETLVLENWSRVDVDDDDDLIKMEESNAIILQIQKLRQVELIKYKGTRNEVYVVDLLKKHRAVLENIIAFPAKENEMLGKPIILWTSSVK